MPLIESIQLVGHACHDRVKNKYILGGTVSYASLVARHLSNEVRLLTSYGEDFLFEKDLKDLGIHVDNVPANDTTIFENRYIGSSRTQIMHKRANDITEMEIQKLRPASLYMFCPIANEMDINRKLLDSIDGFKGATIQGWLRSTDKHRRVIPAIPSLQLFEGLDIAVLSEDDVADLPGLIPELVRIIPIVAITKGEEGVIIFQKGEELHYPSFETKAIEVTGAGDVFATVFMSAYTASNDIVEASSMAHSAASLSIEGIGTKAIPNLQQIRVRQELYRNRYL